MRCMSSECTTDELLRRTLRGKLHVSAADNSGEVERKPAVMIKAMNIDAMVHEAFKLTDARASGTIADEAMIQKICGVH